MSRPTLPLNTSGSVHFVPQPSGRILARAWHRDSDGRRRIVSRAGDSRPAAERALKVALAERPGTGAGATTTIKVAELADVWLAADHDWSDGTTRVYLSIVRTVIKPVLGELRIREVTAGSISRALSAVAERNGPGAAKTARACLSGMFNLAVQDGALTINPVREAKSTARSRSETKRARALTVEKVVQRRPPRSTRSHVTARRLGSRAYPTSASNVLDGCRAVLEVARSSRSTSARGLEAFLGPMNCECLVGHLLPEIDPGATDIPAEVVPSGPEILRVNRTGTRRLNTVNEGCINLALT